MNKNKYLLIIFCILLPLFLLLFSYQTALFFIGKTPPQKETLDFLEGDGGRGELNLKLNLNYTPTELSHLNDVKKVMQGADYFFYGLLLALTLILTHYRKDKRQTIKLLKYGGLITIIFISVLLFFIFISFDFVFTLFHLILFPQGNWLFTGDSLLIRTFPLDFFVKVSWIIAVETLLLGVIFLISKIFIKYPYI